MPRQARSLVPFLIVSALLAGFLLLRPDAPLPTPKPIPKPLFPSPEDGLRYAATRILADRADLLTGNAYASTFARKYTTQDGRTTHHYLLMDEPDRELELAEGFLAHGFGREALVHCENLVLHCPDTSQGKRARQLLLQARQATVLGLVQPLTLVLEDSNGLRFAVGRTPAPPAPGLERIHVPFLTPGVPVPPVRPIGFVDDAGAIVCGSEPQATPPGAAAKDRVYFALPREARSLWDAEQTAKGPLFEKLPERLGLPGSANAVAYRGAARALAYLGHAKEAREILGALGDPVMSPLAGKLDDVARDTSSPLTLDALWLRQLADNPRLALAVPNPVTTGEALPLEVDVHAIGEIAFDLWKLEGPLPAREAEVAEWLRSAPSTLSHRVTLPVREGKSALRLPLREPGSYRVAAQARGLTCRFLAVQADAAMELFAMPAQATLAASRPGLSLAHGAQHLGTTDAGGYLALPPSVLGTLETRPIPPSTYLRPGEKYCAEHRECCNGCESCAHHHVTNFQGSRLFASGAGQIFRATAKIDATQLAKVAAPAPGPILLVTTDRPVYKAGDTLRFRGILRVPKTPLARTDASRLLPAAEREVTVAIRSGESALFLRTYVTGEFGTFAGEFTLPLSARRSDYTLSVTFEGAKTEQPFEVQDYRKSDFIVLLTPASGGLRVQAGYSWGAPVAGTELRCAVNDKASTPQDGLIPAKDGDRVEAVLLRGADELARKSAVYRAPVAAETPAEKPAETPRPAEGAAPADAPAAAGPAEKPPEPVFQVKPSKSLYTRGETIELQVEGPWAGAEATVVLGDLQLYDLARVPIRNGRGTARFPARPLLDPGTAVFALCNGIQARADVRVRTQEMKVEIAAPTKARPGEEVTVTLRADPEAAFSLAAVDEAIYMIREDDAPDLYAHFHPARPAALVHARFEDFELDGASFDLENPPAHPCFKEEDVLSRGVSASMEFVSDKPFRGRGTYDTIGGGAGGGGMISKSMGGRKNMVARGGGGADTEDAVLSGLKLPGRLQNADGSWSTTFASEAGTIGDVGATGLMLLSYLGAGYSHLSKDTYNGVCFGDVVRKGLQWLMRQQDPEGAIGGRAGDGLLNHTLAALALAEAYGLTGSNLYKDQAQRAIDFLGSRQSANGGWHPRDLAMNGEVLATVFAVMAFKSAEISGLQFPAASVGRADRFFEGVLDEDGLSGNPPTRARVGGAMLALLFIRADRSDPRVQGAARWLLRNRPAWAQEDFLGWQLGSLALFRFDGPSGPAWRSWNEEMKAALLPNQAKDGLWTVRGERIFHTALGSLTMEVYYRYANVFGVAGGTGGGRIVSGGGGDQPLAPPPRVRVHFPDTAFWAPELLTDGKGEARAAFTLPDTITTTRLTARGVTRAGAVGQAVGRIAVRQPFFVKVKAPEFAVLEDRIDVRVEIFNYMKEELEATVALEGWGEPRKARVPIDRPAVTFWTVRANDPNGLRLVATARAKGHEDAMERTVPVRRPGRETFVTLRRKSETGKSLEITAPPGVQDLVVKVHPRRGNLAQLLDALRYLNQYPYG